MREDIGRDKLKGMRIREGEEGLLHRHMHTPNANEYPTFAIEMDGLPPVPFPFLLGV